ncbi:MAG: arylamine N-acetyltransferase [Sphingomonadales bacterium]|nr:arylamine N-acetyltransferase [Sphingomonadales bacterium]MBD3774269.1 arylamine N-acetyltransferase [Paracoccaceae bacterium]
MAIPFENLSIPLGDGIRIDSDSVFAKLVGAGRGGYCFEQNRLFADMLGALGWPVRPLLARVRLGPPGMPVPPRTHVLLLGAFGGETWIADAGFGGSYVPPLPLREGDPVATADGARHRLRRADGGLDGEWLLERAGPAAATDGRGDDHGDWQAQYSFDLAPVAPEDLEQANHWTATRPGTRFTTLRIASIVRDAGFAALTDGQLTLHENGVTRTQAIDDAAGWQRVLAEIFGIELDLRRIADLGLF